MVKAKAGRADLLITPELYLTGYNFFAGQNAEPVGGPNYVAASDLAREFNISLLFCFAEKGTGGKVYDSATLFYRTGKPVLHYRKVNLAAGEDQIFAFGDTGLAPVVEIDGVRIGVLICWDIFVTVFGFLCFCFC
jgi:predicted amidohydrolase